jgi:predicted DNA-binding helix-hairpin-helix protein
MQALAPAKNHAEVEDVMGTITHHMAEAQAPHRGRARAPSFAPAGQSTQMMVGATASPDQAILKTASHLYKRFNLKRVYYSAFSPIAHGDARLPLQKPPMIREHRLYQADWLMRFYGFHAEELTEAATPNLDLNTDPKMAWALRHRDMFPIDVNTAARELLLRVPGFGIVSVERILQTRRLKRLRLEDLGKMHIPMRRTRYFVRCADHNVALRQLDSSRLQLLVCDAPKQLSLFEASASAKSGQL